MACTLTDLVNPAASGAFAGLVSVVGVVVVVVGIVVTVIVVVVMVVMVVMVMMVVVMVVVAVVLVVVVDCDGSGGESRARQGDEGVDLAVVSCSPHSPREKWFAGAELPGCKPGKCRHVTLTSPSPMEQVSHYIAAIPEQGGGHPGGKWDE